MMMIVTIFWAGFFLLVESQAFKAPSPFNKGRIRPRASKLKTMLFNTSPLGDSWVKSGPPKPLARPATLPLVSLRNVLLFSATEIVVGTARRLYHIGTIPSALSSNTPHTKKKKKSLGKGLLARGLVSLLSGTIVRGPLPLFVRLLLAWFFYPSFIATMKGMFYPMAAATVLCQTMSMKYSYFILTLPWWLSNKFSLLNGGEKASVLAQLYPKDDYQLQALFYDHEQCRMDRDVLTTGAHGFSNWTVHDVTTHLCGYGGSLLTQYFTFGADHINKYYSWHETVAAAAHVLDDFADQEEDLQTNRTNYFNDFPDTIKGTWGIHFWIHEMQRARRYFRAREDDAMVRFIDGSCTIPCLFHNDLHEIVFGEETDLCDLVPSGRLWFRKCRNAIKRKMRKGTP